MHLPNKVLLDLLVTTAECNIQHSHWVLSKKTLLNRCRNHLAQLPQRYSLTPSTSDKRWQSQTHLSLEAKNSDSDCQDCMISHWFYDMLYVCWISITSSQETFGCVHHPPGHRLRNKPNSVSPNRGFTGVGGIPGDLKRCQGTCHVGESKVFIERHSFI